MAFAATAVHEHARTLRRGVLPDDLCVEHLFWRCKQLDANHSDGTRLTSARDALADPGQCEERHWPYTPARDLAAPYEPPTAVATAMAARASMRGVAIDDHSLAQTLAAGQPIVAGFLLWDGFYNCTSAQLAAPAADIDMSARHAVCLCGLDGPAVMVRNSWGPRWGRNGYAWTSLAGLAPVLQEAWAIEDDVDSGICEPKSHRA